MPEWLERILKLFLLLVGLAEPSEFHQASKEEILYKLDRISLNEGQPSEQDLEEISELMRDFRIRTSLAGANSNQQYIEFLRAYDIALDMDYPQAAIDALALELYEREDVDLGYLAENVLNNPLDIEDHPEMELLTPSFNTEWGDSVKIAFLNYLELDSTQLSNYEPNYFNQLVSKNSLAFADIVSEVYVQSDEGEDAEDYIREYFNYKVIPGISLKSMLALVTGNH